MYVIIIIPLEISRSRVKHLIVVQNYLHKSDFKDILCERFLTRQGDYYFRNNSSLIILIKLVFHYFETEQSEF